MNVLHAGPRQSCADANCTHKVLIFITLIIVLPFSPKFRLRSPRSRVAVCRYYNREKIMTVISLTHQVPIKICPLFWKMLIIGCAGIIMVVVDGGGGGS